MNVRKNAKPPTPVWDLYEDGISFSLITNLIECKERGRIKVVEGLSSDDFSYPIEFGNFFHDCMEHNHESFVQLKKRLKLKAEKVARRHNMTAKGREEVFGMVEIILIYWKNYLAHWSIVDEKIKWVEPEHQFSVDYKIDPYRPITLRGKIDGIIERDGARWLIENKTKSSFPRDLLDTLPHNLQTMMYSVASELETGIPVEGVLWNGVKRPTIHQKRSETFAEYLKRLDGDMQERPEHYFLRIECRFQRNDIKEWERACFRPLLVSIIEWWESLKKNPHDPFVVDRRDPQAVEDLLRKIESSGEKGCVVSAADVPPLMEVPNPHHYERPIGVYDPMSFGIDRYFDYIVSGVKGSLTKVSTMFPELEEEE